MDRQDIDALLIGALYGELTPAEEARLATHLESHPTDRGALDDLKMARHAVRESRIFEMQLDPPQHLSALLLQEAHRRAPKRVVKDEEKESWFSRFARSFMAHPAMAAAAMLVLVIGVAGTLYMKKGADFATKNEASPPQEEVAAQSAPTGRTGLAEGQAAGSAAAPPAETAPTDQYQAGLYDKNADTAAFRSRDEAEAKKQVAKEDSASAEDRAKSAAALKKKGMSRGIVVGTVGPEPKELESGKDRGGVVGGVNGNFDLDGADDSVARSSSTRAGAGGAGRAPGVGVTSTETSNYATVPKAPPGRAPATATPNGPYAQPPPPPPRNDKASIAQNKLAPTTPSAGANKAEPPEKPRDAKVATKSAPSKSEAAPAQEQQRREESSLIAWAKSEHNAVKALVRKGQCESAAKRALGVSNRAPDYYSQNMATDRDLKSCMAYINAERDKDAEKSGKARAQKRVNADEAQPAPAPSK